MHKFDDVEFNDDGQRLRAWARNQQPMIVSTDDLARWLGIDRERIGVVLGNFTTTQRFYGAQLLVKAGPRRWAVNPTG